MGSERCRLTILVSHPIQYFAPLYRELSRRDDLDVHVIFHARAGIESYFDEGFGREVRWDVNLLEGYSHEFLSESTDVDAIAWSIVRILGKRRPQVLLVHGYSSATNLLAILAARRTGTRVLMRGDTRLSPRHNRETAKSLAKRLFFRLVDGFVAVGSLNADYYRAMGVPEGRIHFAAFAVDNDTFALGSAWPEARRSERRRIDIADSAVVVAFASKLIARKRAADLLAAFATLMERFPDAVLVVAGSGEEERALRELAAPLGGRVRFIGFRNQSELPALFAASDVFVLPASEEPWGLVVNEAMAAGLPVIVSDDVGAAPDLVEGKGTGVVYPVGDVPRLAEGLSGLLASPDLRRQMGHAAERLIDGWSVKASAGGIARAVAAVGSR